MEDYVMKLKRNLKAARGEQAKLVNEVATGCGRERYGEVLTEYRRLADRIRLMEKQLVDCQRNTTKEVGISSPRRRISGTEA
jgi:hypothetical protein